MTATWEPVEMVVIRARYPEPRPMTSTTKQRRCEAAVARIMSTRLIMVLSAVSTPMPMSVPKMSLSMVPGRR